MDPTFWRIDEGGMYGLSVGRVIGLVADGSSAHVVLDGRQIITLDASTSTPTTTPDGASMTLVNKTEGWRAVLSRVADPALSAASAGPVAVPAPAGLAPVAATISAVAPPPATAPATTASVTPNDVVVQRDTGPSMAVRAVWFIFIGWWLGAVAIVIAYFLCITIVGIPFAFAIFNRLPAIITLRPRTDLKTVEVRDGVTYISRKVAQRPLWIRAAWFILVGWWVGAIYLTLAWVLCVIVIGLPLGLLMFTRVGGVMTLLRY